MFLFCNVMLCLYKECSSQLVGFCKVSTVVYFKKILGKNWCSEWGKLFETLRSLWCIYGYGCFWVCCLLRAPLTHTIKWLKSLDHCSGNQVEQFI